MLSVTGYRAFTTKAFSPVFLARSMGVFQTLDRTLIIAEIGNNHEGDIAVARDLVLRAADTGVDAVKFQTFIPEHYCSVRDAARMETLNRFRLSFDQFAELAELARSKGLLFLSTPFDLESARFLGTVVDAIKIASGDNTFYPLIETAAAAAKPMIISTGLAGHDEIARAVDCAERAWRAKGVAPGLALLHCVASYPVPEDQANLGAIRTLADGFPKCTAGYSDHTIGADAAVLAVGLGARVIEKHFTLDTNFSDFRDHQLSADPEMMQTLVTAVRRAETMIGDGVLGTMPCEEPMLTPVRRSVVAARDLAAGETVSAEDVTWVRPGGGIPPGGEDGVIGRTLHRDVAQGDMIQSDILADILADTLADTPD
jgi:sialic acid synthase SpsE